MMMIIMMAAMTTTKTTTATKFSRKVNVLLNFYAWTFRAFYNQNIVCWLRSKCIKSTSHRASIYIYISWAVGLCCTFSMSPSVNLIWWFIRPTIIYLGFSLYHLPVVQQFLFYNVYHCDLFSVVSLSFDGMSLVGVSKQFYAQTILFSHHIHCFS